MLKETCIMRGQINTTYWKNTHSLLKTLYFSIDICFLITIKNGWWLEIGGTNTRLLRKSKGGIISRVRQDSAIKLYKPLTRFDYCILKS